MAAAGGVVAGFCLLQVPSGWPFPGWDLAGATAAEEGDGAPAGLPSIVAVLGPRPPAAPATPGVPGVADGFIVGGIPWGPPGLILARSAPGGAALGAAAAGEAASGARRW